MATDLPTTTARTYAAARERFLRLSPFWQLFLTGTGVGMLGWSVVFGILDWPLVFGGTYRMILYHAEHPVPYVALVAGVYAFLGSLWLRSGPSPHRGRRLAATLGIEVGTIALSSGPAGMIWVFHDMCAGWFPEGDRMVSAFAWGFTTGLEVGPVVVLTAIPMNLIAIVVGSRALLRLADATVVRGD